MDLSTLITNINGKDFAKAQVIFDDMMNAKVTDALDKEKIKLAGQVFNGDPEDDEDLVDEVEVEGDEESGLTRPFLQSTHVSRALACTLHAESLDRPIGLSQLSQ